jgi:serine/threonine-protein kinase
MLEALFLSYVRHPAVVRIHAAGQDREIDYLVLEFFRGENLDQVMVREGRLSPVEAARLLEAAADALAAVHLRGVIHCDVKPGNIMRTDRDRVKLVDFGLARFLGSGAWPFGEGVITASPHYMSLEQAEGRPLDCRTDIYSLGATFYHVLAGEPPYGDAEMDTLSHYLAAPPVPVRAVAPGIPSALARILDRMMERRPENRPASMIDVRDAVGAWLKDQGQSAA